MFVDLDDQGPRPEEDEWLHEHEPMDEPIGPVVDLEQFPGPRLAIECHTASAVPSMLTDGEVLDVVQGVDLLPRWAAALRIRMVAEFADRHPEGSSAPPPGASIASPVSRWLPDEIGAALRIARLEALGEIARARRFVHVLPDTLAYLEMGRIDERRADAIASATALLPTEKARAVEARVLPHAPDATLKQLRDRVRRAIARIDPDGEHRRHKEATGERRVTIQSLDDGMASLWFYGPAEQIEAAWTMADRLARAPQDPDDERTLDQRRFDLAVQVLQGRLTVTDMADVRAAVASVLEATTAVNPPTTADSPTTAGSDATAVSAGAANADLSTTPISSEADNAGGTDPDGAHPADGRTATAAQSDSPAGAPTEPPAGSAGHEGAEGGGEGGGDRGLLTEIVAQVLAARPPMHATVHKPLIQVVVGLDTLFGGDRPAELVGHGPITALTARALAAGGVWKRLVTDPLSGGLLDYGRSVYAPPPDLADFVRARDQICRGPGCTRRIGELDHHIPFGGGHDGETSEKNLNGYCKHCHLLKDAPGWNALAETDRSLTWISPHGRRTTTRPYDYRPFTDDTPSGADPTNTPGDTERARVPDNDPPPF